MIAVEAVQNEKQFKVASDYTCAAYKTSHACTPYKSGGNSPILIWNSLLAWFAHVTIVRLKACFASKCSSTALKRTGMWGCLLSSSSERTADICSARFVNLRNFEIALRNLKILKLLPRFRKCMPSDFKIATQFRNSAA